MKILEHHQIQQKIKRLAIQILERHYGESEIVLAGLNTKGLAFAERLLAELRTLAPETMTFSLTRIRLNPADPLEYAPYIEMPEENLRGKIIIVTDDVANTGRTLFFAMKPLLGNVPRRVEVAVLVDRKHKSFPIQPDYVGLSLYTTMRDDIEVRLGDDGQESAVYLH
ncbi:MAG: phosphoribosyltransferase family protein [Saprospiraceae bacterium]|nr:phosphoribosyltransferase family protein [Saprospiraceae bacterium]MDW8228332.1 phosphoribosyltransferase family protein [Saprospiraceae bacterium]